MIKKIIFTITLSLCPLVSAMEQKDIKVISYRLRLFTGESKSAESGGEWGISTDVSRESLIELLRPITHFDFQLSDIGESLGDIIDKIKQLSIEEPTKKQIANLFKETLFELLDTVRIVREI